MVVTTATFACGRLRVEVAPMLAQDPVKVDPAHYKVEFENALCTVSVPPATTEPRTSTVATLDIVSTGACSAKLCKADAASPCYTPW